MSFPSSLPSYAGFTATHTLQADTHASQHNSEQTDILGIASKVGLGASTPTSGNLLRGNGVGTSTWSQAQLASDVAGILSTSNGGTGQGNLNSLPLVSPVISSGGSWAGNPSFTGQPQVADFTNSDHSHANTAGGGTLNGANALQSGSVSFANLLSSIFGGQVQTQANTGNAGGTMWYINLGGIRLCWGVTLNNTAGAAPSTFHVTPPTSFFTTTQVALAVAQPGGDARSQVSVVSLSTTDLPLFYYNSAGTFSATAHWLIIGT